MYVFFNIIPKVSAFPIQLLFGNIISSFTSTPKRTFFHKYWLKRLAHSISVSDCTIELRSVIGKETESRLLHKKTQWTKSMG